MTDLIQPQCSAMVQSGTRPVTRCTRRAAKKHDYKFCGLHAPTPPVCGSTQGDAYRYHRTDCVGCRHACCRDRSLHIPGRCFVRTDGGLQPVKAVSS